MYYFLSAVCIVCFCRNPFYLGAALLIGGICAAFSGGKAFAKSLLWVAPTVILIAVINPLFNHRGVTVLTHFASGNPLTAESVYFGFSAAASMAAVIFIFFVFNRVMTSDKLICLTGRLSPSLSLVLSMSLRFVPRFRERLALVRRARANIGSQNKFMRSIRTFSAMLTWCLESGVETADSMRSRGFGCTKRTSFSIFRFSARDGVYLGFMLVCTLLAAVFHGKYSYFPSFTAVCDPVGFVSFCLFLAVPLVSGLTEAEI